MTEMNKMVNDFQQQVDKLHNGVQQLKAECIPVFAELDEIISNMESNLKELKELSERRG